MILDEDYKDMWGDLKTMLYNLAVEGYEVNPSVARLYDRLLEDMQKMESDYEGTYYQMIDVSSGERELLPKDEFETRLEFYDYRNHAIKKYEKDDDVIYVIPSMNKIAWEIEDE